MDADIPVMLFACRKIHAVKRYQSPWHRHSEKLPNQELEMLRKLLIVLAIPHVPVAVRIGIQARERRRKYRIVDAVRGKL